MKTKLQENIDRYMDLKGIKYYSGLLYEIGKQLGKSKSEAREFANKEKSNFSKTLKGDRPLKHEFIIPLEIIFGVPLAKILNEQLYFVSVQKEDIPFLKSFRYYAYKDDYKLYDELYKTSTVDGDDIISNRDEYNRYFLDYLIEYRSFNGLKFLTNEHHLRYNPMTPDYYLIDGNAILFVTLPIQMAKFIIDSNDYEIFNKIYDLINFLIKYRYLNVESLYTDEEFIEAIVNNKAIFNSLFLIKEYDFKNFNDNFSFALKNDQSPIIHCINPLVNICLDYCLKNHNLYKNQIINILEFGKKYNQDVLDSLRDTTNKIECDCYGNLFIDDRLFCTNLIYTDIDKIEDKEIDLLIEQLPKLKRGNN